MNGKNEEETIKKESGAMVSKMDKWKYDNILSLLARNCIFTKGTQSFYMWVDRLATALRCINTKQLPLRQKIDVERKQMNECYNEDTDYLEKVEPHAIKRFVMEDSIRQQHYENFLDFLLDLATDSGFTIYLVSEPPKVGGGGIGFSDDQMPFTD